MDSFLFTSSTSAATSSPASTAPSPPAWKCVAKPTTSSAPSTSTSTPYSLTPLTVPLTRAPTRSSEGQSPPSPLLAPPAASSWAARRSEYSTRRSAPPGPAVAEGLRESFTRSAAFSTTTARTVCPGEKWPLASDTNVSAMCVLGTRTVRRPPKRTKTPSAMTLATYPGTTVPSSKSESSEGRAPSAPAATSACLRVTRRGMRLPSIFSSTRRSLSTDPTLIASMRASAACGWSERCVGSMHASPAPLPPPAAAPRTSRTSMALLPSSRAARTSRTVPVTRSPAERVVSPAPRLCFSLALLSAFLIAALEVRRERSMRPSVELTPSTRHLTACPASNAS
mmetsp:Transcript_15689/g.49280  ORF Transcript_15689/g.49280 Transcript_15689/m.49280 type:complete len:339 (-) Transcript_15689:1843-2859(-)